MNALYALNKTLLKMLYNGYACTIIDNEIAEKDSFEGDVVTK
jgi:hypothetical protein